MAGAVVRWQAAGRGWKLPVRWCCLLLASRVSCISVDCDAAGVLAGVVVVTVVWVRVWCYVYVRVRVRVVAMVAEAGVAVVVVVVVVRPISLRHVSIRHFCARMILVMLF